MRKKAKGCHKVKPNGFTLIEVLLVLVIIGLILSVLVLILNSKQKELRDSKRISDMQALHSALQVVKNETGSFTESYCPISYVSLCAQAQNSFLLKVLPTLGSFNDPKNTDTSCSDLTVCAKKECNYSITKMDTNEYEILFHLEKGTGLYSQKGCYKVNAGGISLK